MLSETRVRKLLTPFDLELSPGQIGQLMTYLELLLRWNQKINLTAIRNPEECVTRHFGESLYLSRWVTLQGESLDVGSGAGFPGLALKIVFPALKTTLLEPVGKKRAFLKEVVRACSMELVEARPERLEEFARGHEAELRNSAVAGSAEGRFDSVTMRAVGPVPELVGLAKRCLRRGGRLCLWLGREQSQALVELEKSIAWRSPIPLPLATQREILVGEQRLS
jgi:16S rRNA (guanine527-N7)-methyltransferase